MYGLLLDRGSRPLPGYECVEDIGGTPVYRLWKMRSIAEGSKLWQVLDRSVATQVFDLRNLTLILTLRHSNINPYLRMFELPDTDFLVLESPLPQSNWHDRLAEVRKAGRPGVPWRELMDYVKQAAAALDFLNTPQHSLEGQTVALYHRNLLPENLLLFRSGAGYTTKVSNFGLAKATSDDSTNNSRGLMNYDYDPPEFFEGTTAPTSDQFSLAVNYVEMRTGRRPFSGMLLEQLAQRTQGRMDLSLLASAEQTVIKRALAPNPADRFASCTEFASSLAAVVEAVENNGRPPSKAGSPSSSQFRKSAVRPLDGSTIRPPAAPPANAAPTNPPEELPDAEEPRAPAPAPFEFQESGVPFHLAAGVAMAVFAVVAYFAVSFLRG